MRSLAPCRVFDVDGGDEQTPRAHRAPDLREERAVEEIEVADQIEGVRLEGERVAFQIADARLDAAFDAAAARLVQHAIDPDARAVERLDAPALLGEVDRVPARPAGEIERETGRKAANRVREGH